jgi:hypothetical protein
MHAPPPIGHADLHVHPSGDGISVKTPMAVYAALRASGLQVAVLTDHNRVDVARELVARSRDEGLPIVLLVGGGDQHTRRSPARGRPDCPRAGRDVPRRCSRRRPRSGRDRGGCTSAAADLHGGLRWPAHRTGRVRPPLSSRRPRGDASNGRVGARLATARRTARGALRVCRRRWVRRPRRPLGRARTDLFPRQLRSRTDGRDPWTRDMD